MYGCPCFYVPLLTQTHTYLSYLTCLISVIGLLSAIEEVCSVAEMAGDRAVKCCVNTTQIDHCFDDVDSLLSLMSMVTNLDAYDRQAGQSKFLKVVLHFTLSAWYFIEAT